jgi:uncharacterized protein YcgI (DUF1989 family)
MTVRLDQVVPAAGHWSGRLAAGEVLEIVDLE